MTNNKSIPALCLVLFLLCLTPCSAEAQSAFQQRRTEAFQHIQDGNYKQAYDLFRQLALDPDDQPASSVGTDLQYAITCLQNLNRFDEVDTLREAIIKVHPSNWQLLRAAARSYLQTTHYGYLISGEFQRGSHRGGGKRVSSFRRDRVHALQLFHRALTASTAAEPSLRAQLHVDFAQAFLQQDNYWDALWQLQVLTDLGKLPELDEANHYYYRASTSAAPAHADGTPVYFYKPRDWQSARNDGERWRWLLARAVQIDPGYRDSSLQYQAQLYLRLYGVQTLVNDPQWSRQFRDDEQLAQNSLYSVRRLKEDETMARLASGVARFELPDEFNYIRIYQTLLATQPMVAHNALAHIFENRQQYPEAARHLRALIARAPNTDHYKTRLAAIVDNWGRFEPGAPQAAGNKGELLFRFRNARALKLAIYRIDTERLLRDLKAYIRSSPSDLDYRKLDVNRIGYRLVVDNEQQYLVERVAAWTEQLQPLEKHFDTRIRIKTPVTKAGAYLVVGKLANGNTSRIVMWLNDTVLVRKPMDQKLLYYAADAKDGHPVKGLTLSFFGYKREAINKLPRPLRGLFYKTRIRQFDQNTSVNGMVTVDDQQQASGYNWLVTAHNSEGRLAFLGLQGVWYDHYREDNYNATKYFGITDRPVYRPGHKVSFKIWAQYVSYHRDDTTVYRNQAVTLRVIDAKGNKVFEHTAHSNNLGGVDAGFTLADDAALGVYRYGFASGKNGLRQAGSFRVEEYKKPEFEVSVTAPDKPVLLGEQVKLQVSARYYFGAPVTQGKVKYKILRYSQTDRWYPPSRWDWLYGRGYGWQAYDYDWYPGWEAWGCVSPIPPWRPVAASAPELVAENEVPLNAQGRLTITLDTALAKQLHGDTDHRFEITAEVTDNSRRTIIGQTSITIARAPFKVYAWVDRGYYQPGDPVHAEFTARTASEQAVSGDGQLSLYKISYDQDGKPHEELLKQWPASTDSRGHVEQRFVAGGPGQYRISLKLSDAQGHKREGAYVYGVTGDNIDAQSVRFNPIEVLSHQSSYHPGQEARLLLNSQQAGSTVLLFLRPLNGVYRAPEVIRLDGKSTQRAFMIKQGDMPNLFVEALTIRNGRLYKTVREIAVPPQKRTLDVNIVSDKQRYRPGETAKLKVRATDEHGDPVQGDTVLTIYDKAVEYISGGSNVAAIRPFFWQWRHHHRSQELTNLQRRFGDLLRPSETPMRNIGVLGNLLGQSRKRSPYSRMAESDSVASAMVTEESAAPAPGVEQSKKLEGNAGGKSPHMETYSEAHVRKAFADTAYWSAAVSLDHNGEGEIEFTLPENLTTWQIRGWSLARGTRVGEAEYSIKTFKNLLLRMQAPRFFVEKDEVVLSANIHNYLDRAQSVKAILELDGDTLAPLSAPTQHVDVDKNGEARVDWVVKVQDEGEAIVRMKALAQDESDAMQMQFPVYVHGMDRFVSVTGSLQSTQQNETFTIDVPAARRVDSTLLTVQFSPSLAGAMVDALPYLVDYPYGCTEQTLSRFLPTVITQNVLREMDIDLKAIAAKRNNLNAQQLGDPRERARQWHTRRRNPVFDINEVQDMSAEGRQRLLAMQVSDGGWGWFSGYGEQSYPHTTAYVMHGLRLARKNDLKVPAEAYQRGINWLQRYLQKRVDKIRDGEQQEPPLHYHANNVDAFVYMVLANNDIANEAMRDYLYRDRNELSVYAKAMFALGLTRQQQPEMVTMLLSNIEQYLVMDPENETAYLNLPNSGYWWYWYGSENEAHAYYLKLLARLDPGSKKAAWLVKYLINNRRHGGYWKSTRDTAVIIEALADYLKATGQHHPDMQVAVYIDGKPYSKVKIDKTNLFTFNNRIEVKGRSLRAGAHTVRLEKQGGGPLFYNAYLSYFSLEDPIPPAGLEIKVKRRYFKLEPIAASRHVAGAHGQALSQRIEQYKRIPLDNLDSVKSGDKVEVELTIDSKNDYEYLVFEDFKPAGFEPIEVRSGYNGNEMGAYVEYRDERVSFFVRGLARGRHSLSYRLYAEVPGRYSALPARGFAMYAPELKANSDELKLRIEDAPLVTTR
jgi:uncharacterized protein YfaS (alpha-2-macroglobulin family)